MLFNSLHFLIFFIIITSLYFSLPYRHRWFLLLAGSCYFYMAFIPIYITILGFTIVIDYFAGILIERATGRKRRLYLLASLCANIGVLAVFKYYNFLNENLTLLLSGFSLAKNPIPYLSILLPIGLSFHTFQAMSYTIEVYRGHQKAERNFGIYALYVMFFPQLVAGPIERPQNLLHQFREKHDFDYDRVTGGLKLMAWGLFKKAVIADRLAIIVDNVYNKPSENQGLSLIIATVFFAYQIFCDFSGYSDMAIGAAQVMGFKLTNNFNRPYSSKNMSEFWSRWHISLSTWFRDYLYIPLGGNRVSSSRWYFNLFFVFLVCGLWHGPNWTFIIWGALHGFYLVFALITKTFRKNISATIGLDKLPQLQNALQRIITFCLATFAWVFFRAKTVSEALSVVKYSAQGLLLQIDSILHHLPLHLNFGVSKSSFLFAVIAIISLESVHLIQESHNIGEWFRAKPIVVRWSIYYATFFIILVFGVFDKRQFIYFQF
jgi:alginate O-acetyltransferase complex protein AlgI